MVLVFDGGWQGGIHLNCSQARLITPSPLQPRSAYFAYYKLATHPAGHQLRILLPPSSASARSQLDYSAVPIAGASFV